MASAAQVAQEGAGVVYDLTDDDQQVGQFLRFGDEVSFFDRRHHGYMLSHLTSTAHASLVVQGVEDPKVPQEIGNFQTCVFQIQAHNKYKANRELAKALDKIRVKERKPDMDLEQAMRHDPTTLMHLKHMADAEGADNKLEQKRRHGDRVVYGQLIQLWHGHTRKYIKISSTTTSKREASNMRVEMDAVTNKGSWFRIMPRYKVKAEGDYVRVGDQVKLESVKTAGQFLHSAGSPEDEIDAGCFEINLCVEPSSFVLQLVRHPNDGDLHFLNSGDVVQLFHKEISAYVAAEGDFSNEQPRQDVHLRIRLPDPKRPSRLSPPTSAVSFWQIESDQNPHMNQVVLWEEDVRLKHLTTQMYLAIDENEEMHLTRNRDDGGVFRFYAVIREQRAIQMGSYARIEHVSGVWMHAESDAITRTRYAGAGPKNELSQRTQDIVWDEAELRRLGWSQERMFDDAFIITYVPLDYVYQVAFVSGMIPIVRSYIEKRAVSELEEYESMMVAQSLKELRDFMFVRGSVVKTRQKLIRNLGMVEMLLDVLQVPLRPYNTTKDGLELKDLELNQFVGTKKVLHAVYSVLETYLSGDCRKNELYIAKHIPFFQTQIGGFVPVEKMYTELVRDNPKIVHTIHEEEMAEFVQLLQESKNPDYLAFLSALCECEDVAIHHNQEVICRLLLESKGLPMVYMTELNPSHGAVEVSVDGKTWQMLEQFAETAMDDDDSTSTREYLFLQQQLEIFGQLCLGRNMHCIDVITQKLGYLTWGECFHCAQNPKLPKSLRAMYVALMANLFIDVPHNVDILEDVQLVYNWNKLTDTPNADAAVDRTRSLSGSCLPFFPDLHEWLLTYLKQKTSLCAADRSENKLIAEVLRLLLFLVKFGFYAAPEDILTLMEPLMGILDGQGDRPNESTVSFVNDSFAKEWRVKGRYQRNGDNELVMDVKYQALEVVDALLNFTLTVRLQHFLYDFKSVADWSGDRRDTRGLSSDIKPGQPTLTFNQMRALQMLTRTNEPEQILQFTEDVRDYLRDLYERSNYITPKWQAGDRIKSNRGELVSVLQDLAKYDDSRVLTSSLKILNRIYSAQNHLFKYTTQAQVLTVKESVLFMDSLSEKVATLRRLGAGLIEGADEEEFLALTSELSTHCYLEDGEPHEQNQNILVNAGIVPVLFDVVDYEEQNPSPLCGTFRLLRALAVKNATVQQMLFNRLDTLMAVEGSSDGWQNDMAYCLTEIFTNNQKLCLAVKAKSVEKMMLLLADQSSTAPNALRLLQAVCKVEEMNIPLKRNQALIVKYLMQYRDKIINVAFIDDASDERVNAQRLEMLQRQGFFEETLLEYHLELVSLLSACAEGENRFIESVCQTIFSVDEILQVLGDPDIKAEYKTHYMKFLLWVYLNTAGSPLEVGTYKLPMDPRLWGVIKDLAEKEIASYCIAGPLSVEQTSLAFDAYVPILTKVVRSFYQPAEYPLSVGVVKEVAGILSDFVSRALPSIYNRDQVKGLSACLMSIQTATDKGTVSPNVMQALGAKLTAGEAGLLESDSQHQYHRKFQKQTELNGFLNVFAHNVRVAYEGANTIEAQLPHAQLPEEEMDDDYAEDETQDEYVPLGPEFQAFVRLFWNGGVSENVASLVRLIKVSNRLGATLPAKDKLEQDQVDIRAMQIMRTLIHNEEKLGRPIRPVQDALCVHRVVLPVANVLHNTNDFVVREALACLAAILKDGNKQAQGLFEEHFLGTREETFFEDVQSRMRRALDSMVETRILVRQTREERDKQRKLMGTMTMAGALGGQLQNALAGVERLDEASPVDVYPHDTMEMQVNPGVRIQAPPPEQQHSRKYDSKDEDDVIQEEDEGNMELVLRVLQLLCEGHRARLQNYLRTQPDNIRSIDLIAETARFLSALVEEIHEGNIDLVIQTVDSLVEFAQGCVGNQGTIFDSRTVDQVNFIMRLPEFPGCTHNKVATVKLACANLVLAMIEDSDPDTVNMAKELEETLDIPAVFKTLQSYYELSKQGLDESEVWGVDEDAGEEPTAAIDVAFGFYNIIRRLEDFSGTPYYNLSDYNPMVEPELTFGEDDGEGGANDMEEAAAPTTSGDDSDDDEEEEEKVDGFAAISDRAVSIELLRDGRLQKVHFLDRWSKHLRPEVKEELLWSVDRASPADKIRDYVERCRVIMADIKYLRGMQEHNILNQIVMDYSIFFSKVLLLLTFILNIMILLSWDASPDWTEPRPDFNNGAFEPLLTGLGAVHLIVSVLVSVGYFLVHPPSVRALMGSVPFGSYVLRFFPEDDSNRTLTSILSVTSLHHILLVVFSLLGIMFDGYFFCYHLLHVIVNNDILLRVIQSVTKNGVSLLWVAALMVIIIYIYSLVAFAFLRKNFDESEGAYCQDMLQCFTSSLKLGLLSGGGLGEALPPATHGFRETGLRVFFDLSFFIIITIIGLNVVFGIIVDTFSELRDEKYQIQEAMDSECFICSLKNYDFERFGNGFQNHVKHEHNMWNYLFYMMHLEEKEPTDYTSNESYVSEALAENKETTFFPINRALVLSKSDEEGLEDRIGSIESVLRDLVSRIDASEARAAEERRRAEQRRLFTGRQATD